MSFNLATILRETAAEMPDAIVCRAASTATTYQQLDDKAYPEVFMDQSGMNATSTRHMDLLMRGLDAEER